MGFGFGFENRNRISVLKSESKIGRKVDIMKTIRTWKMLARTRRALKSVIPSKMYSLLGDYIDDLYDKWNLAG